MARLLPAVGDPRELVPANGRTFTLPELQHLVGGYIEALRTPDGRWLFINENGKNLELPANLRATMLMDAVLADDDIIVGNAVLCTMTEAGGIVDWDDLTDCEREYLAVLNSLPREGRAAILKVLRLLSKRQKQPLTAEEINECVKRLLALGVPFQELANLVAALESRDV